MTSSSSVLRVRINHIDHILVEPGPLDNSSQQLVPIIRVYGISSIGKKTCVHIHQVYPYFYIEYTGNVDPESGMAPYVNSSLDAENQLCSGELYGRPNAFHRPCHRVVVQTKSVVIQIALCPSGVARQGCAFLWVSFVVRAIPQNTHDRPLLPHPCRHSFEVWRGDVNEVQRVREPHELLPSIYV